MGHVHRGDAAAGNDEAKSLAADEAVLVALLLHLRRDFLARRMLRLVDVLEHHHLRAVDRAGRLAAGKARLIDQRRVAAGVDEAGRLHVDVAVARGQMQRLDAPAFDIAHRASPRRRSR